MTGFAGRSKKLELSMRNIIVNLTVFEYPGKGKRSEAQELERPRTGGDDGGFAVCVCVCSAERSLPPGRSTCDVGRAYFEYSAKQSFLSPSSKRNSFLLKCSLKL